MVADANVRGDSAMEKKKGKKKKKKRRKNIKQKKENIFPPFVLKLCCFDLGI